MQIFNFRDGRVTTVRHHSGAYICQMPGHRLSRLEKITNHTKDIITLLIGLIALSYHSSIQSIRCHPILAYCTQVQFLNI